MVSTDRLEEIADNLGDIAQALVALIAANGRLKPQSQTWKCRQIASRLRLLADSLSPDGGPRTAPLDPKTFIELSEDVVALSLKADEIIRRTADLRPLPEILRFGVACRVNQLHDIMMMLAVEFENAAGATCQLDLPLTAESSACIGGVGGRGTQPLVGKQ